jgi:hypothetical protein
MLLPFFHFLQNNLCENVPFQDAKINLSQKTQFMVAISSLKTFNLENLI